jgi:hypothetical protein
MNKTTVLACCLTLFFFAFKASDDTYPSKTRLFHIERSKNKNIVCYDFKIDADGKPDTKMPVDVYWINREEEPGKRGELSQIQRKLAYGYTIVGQDDKSVIIELNAVKNRKIIIEEDKQHHYSGKIMINQQQSILHKVYVKTQSINSMSVEYVEISGINTQTGLPVSERIKN